MRYICVPYMAAACRTWPSRPLGQLWSTLCPSTHPQTPATPPQPQAGECGDQLPRPACMQVEPGAVKLNCDTPRKGVHGRGRWCPKGATAVAHTLGSTTRTESPKSPHQLPHVFPDPADILDLPVGILARSCPGPQQAAMPSPGSCATGGRTGHCGPVASPRREYQEGSIHSALAERKSTPRAVRSTAGKRPPAIEGALSARRLPPYVPVLSYHIVVMEIF